jgi:hypothetical protein
MADRGQTQARTDAWLKAACEDADRRGLPELKPLLETLARSTAALREADRTTRLGETGSLVAGPEGLAEGADRARDTRESKGTPGTAGTPE